MSCYFSFVFHKQVELERRHREEVAILKVNETRLQEKLQSLGIEEVRLYGTVCLQEGADSLEKLPILISSVGINY